MPGRSNAKSDNNTTLPVVKPIMPPFYSNSVIHPSCCTILNRNICLNFVSPLEASHCAVLPYSPRYTVAMATTRKAPHLRRLITRNSTPIIWSQNDIKNRMMKKNDSSHFRFRKSNFTPSHRNVISTRGAKHETHKPISTCSPQALVMKPNLRFLVIDDKSKKEKKAKHFLERRIIMPATLPSLGSVRTWRRDRSSLLFFKLPRLAPAENPG